MIRHALRVLEVNGVSDITIVSSPSGVGQLATLLGGGYEYRAQERPGGVFDALRCASRSSDEDIAVVLGDNMFEVAPKLHPAPCCYLHRAVDLSAFGVAVFDADGCLTGVVEKPDIPPSPYAVVGLYVLPAATLGLAPKLSARGEMEITDALNVYAGRGELKGYTFDGFWGDMGTYEGIRACESW